MNLTHVQELLAATDKQRHGFLRISDGHSDYDVRLMVEAGLIEATLSDGTSGSFTSINRVTDLGLKFLRVFQGKPISSLVSLSADDAVWIGLLAENSHDSAFQLEPKFVRPQVPQLRIHPRADSHDRPL